MATWCFERAGAERQARDADPLSRGVMAASGMVVGSTAIDGRFGARSRDRLAWQSERRHWTDRRGAPGDRPAGEERTRRWNGW